MNFKLKVGIITFYEIKEEFYKERNVLVDQEIKKFPRLFGRLQALLNV